MVREARRDHLSQRAVVGSIAVKIGRMPQTLLNCVYRTSAIRSGAAARALLNSSKSRRLSTKPRNCVKPMRS